jgi:hypothetical protein
MPQCQFPVFCCFCVSEMLHKKYSRNWAKQVPELLFFPEEDRRPNESQRVARGCPHHEGARPRPWPRPHMVRPPWSPPDDAPSPKRSIGTENPKTIGVFPRTVPQFRRHHRRISGDRSLYSSTLPGRGSALICFQRIYNFLCSMLVFTLFAYCFVTLRGTFMHFPELTY